MAGRILVLDDEESYARMVQDLLRKESFAVEMETRPSNALETLRQESFDLVVADYKMPVMDGSEFLMEARKVDPRLPVIMISGLMNTPELVKVANIGVTVVLEKPLDVENFLSQVRRFVQPDQAPEDHTDENLPPIQAPTGRKTPELKYLASGAGPLGGHVHRLHSAVDQGPHVLVAAPEGSEFGLMANEISLWRGCDGSRPYWFSAEQLLQPSTEAILRRLNERPDLGSVVVVTDLEDLDSGQQRDLFDRIQGNAGGLFDGLTLAYEIKNLYSFDGDDVDSEFRNWVINQAVRVPPLRERLGDLAAYTRRYVSRFARQSQRPEKRHLSPEAIRFMLGYSWPGNFRELVEVLRIAIGKGSADCVEADDLREAIAELHGKEEHSEDDVCLRALMQRAQQIFLTDQQEHDPAALAATLKDAGVSPTSDPASLDLLIPEVAGD